MLTEAEALTKEEAHVCDGKVEDVGVGDGVQAGEPGDHEYDEAVTDDPGQEDDDVDEDDQDEEILRQWRWGEARGCCTECCVIP